jgi:hypothetical protein
MKEFNKMTKRQLAEYIVDSNIKAGHYKEEIRSFAICQHMMADKATLIWSAEGGKMRAI